MIGLSLGTHAGRKRRRFHTKVPLTPLCKQQLVLWLFKNRRGGREKGVSAALFPSNKVFRGGPPRNARQATSCVCARMQSSEVFFLRAGIKRDFFAAQEGHYSGCGATRYHYSSRSVSTAFFFAAGTQKLPWLAAAAASFHSRLVPSRDRNPINSPPSVRRVGASVPAKSA